MYRNGRYYKALAYKGYSELCINHNETIEGTIKDIEDIVKQAKEQGYNTSEKWLIVQVDWGRFTENDVFVYSWENRKTVALYDNGVVTRDILTVP